MAHLPQAWKLTHSAGHHDIVASWCVFFAATGTNHDAALAVATIGAAIENARCVLGWLPDMARWADATG
jgi:hypothetical protein